MPNVLTNIELGIQGIIGIVHNAECIDTRAVESKSLEVGKSLKIGKNRIKSEKSELIFYLTFLDFLAIY